MEKTNILDIFIEECSLEFNETYQKTIDDAISNNDIYFYQIEQALIEIRKQTIQECKSVINGLSAIPFNWSDTLDELNRDEIIDYDWMQIQEIKKLRGLRDKLTPYYKDDLINDGILLSLGFKEYLINSRTKGSHSIEFQIQKEGSLSIFSLYKRHKNDEAISGYDFGSLGKLMTMKHLYHLTSLFLGKELFLINK